MDRYIALIRKEPGTEYGIEFPDFPGCITSDDTLDGALAAASEALSGHIAVMREHGEAIPAPSGLEAVAADPHYRDAVVVLVAVAPEPSRAVRINISMEERLIAEIDRAAAQLQSNRSAFLADAARAALYGTGRFPEAPREFRVAMSKTARGAKTSLERRSAAAGQFTSVSEARKQAATSLVERTAKAGYRGTKGHGTAEPHGKARKSGSDARGKRK